MRNAITLNEMTHTEVPFTTPYATMVDDRYEMTFTSGHKLTIYKTFGPRPYMLSFKNPANGQFGEVVNCPTPEDALEKFNRQYINNTIRPEIMEGFVA